MEVRHTTMSNSLRQRNPRKPSNHGKNNEEEPTGHQEDNHSLFTGRRTLFLSGIIVGAILAAFFVTPLPEHVELFLEQYRLPGLPSIDLTLIESEWTRFRNSIPEPWKLNNDGREFRVGEEAAARGLSAHHPVILVPGIISTALESWSTSPDYRSYFREKLWGGFHMVAQVTLNREKWIAAMMLDPETGLDPPDVKLRAIQGIDAASSFVQGYWIWSKIIENLAAVNYDTNNLYLASYDWRLSYWNLEERDGYFTRLKQTIENFKTREGRKVVLVGHSMGCTVCPAYFSKHSERIYMGFTGRLSCMKWVEAEGFGNGGPTWVEEHLEAVITIGGTYLGVPKAMTAFLSGEMRDTVAISPAGAYVLERFFSRKERAKLFRSWAGSASMWIKGGESVWGNSTIAPDDLIGHNYSHGHFISFSGQKHPEEANLTATAAINWILEHTPSSFQRMLARNYSYGIERSEERLAKNDLDHTKWSNPLESRLPNAPSLKIYCVYGHGKPTERSYWYARGAFERDDTLADSPSAVCTNATNCSSPRTPLDLPLARASWIDYDLTQDDSAPKIINGVKLGEGDGTVSLISLGGMCVEGWKRKRWNPAGIRIITRELPHQPSPTEPRGGANTSDHIDILGSTGLNAILVKVATGVGHEVKEQITSPIKQYAASIQWD